MNHQSLRTEAIVLRRTNYGEADRILNLITPNHGKLTAIAKGVRRPKSKLAGGLELFAACDLIIRQGRGDMWLVTSSRLIHFYGKILNDYDRLRFGYEVIKMINRATETVTEPDFYHLLHASLAYLDDLDIDYLLVELWFRLRLLDMLGVGPNLATSTDGQVLVQGSDYNFDFASMSFIAHPSGRFSPRHIKFLRLANTKNPAFLKNVSGIEPVLNDCLWLARTIDT
ncbi:MAG TPA: DNA repair protein RecO [Patescibacteria group bacterium]|jgi:DNA repair protein RecO (recombination protein O)|nr:DNA repair protein RecO [Patescibacteria group bacterium]